MPSPLPRITTELRPRRVLTGFFEFINHYGVIPLAIAVVIGNSVNDLVKTIVDGILTPLIALLTPQAKLQGLVVTFHGVSFKVGAVLNATISFVGVSLLIYAVVKLIIRNDALLEKK